MKSLLLMTIALTSFSAFSAMELYFKFENLECKIAGGKVHRTQTHMKGEISSTVSYDFKSSGNLEEVAARAAAHSSGEPNFANLTQTVILNGESFILNRNDSPEASALISVMSSACK